MKRLCIYLKVNLKETILAPLFKMAEALLELLIPVIVADIIDNGIPNGDTRYIITKGVLMIVLGCIGFGFAILAQYFAAKCAADTAAGLRKDLFIHINSLSYKEIDSIGTSTFITRMTVDINQVQQAINMFLRLFLRSPFIVIGAAICACLQGKGTNIIFIITVPALFALVFIILILTMPLNAHVQQVIEKITLSIRENVAGVRVIRAFNRQDDENNEFIEKTEELYKKQKFSGAVSGLLNPLSYAVINLAVVAILYTGGGEVYDGIISRGVVVALVNYMSQILVEIIKLANLIILESKGLASLKRVNAIFAVNDSLKDGTKELYSENENKGAFDITLDNVTFCYGENTAPAVDDISLDIHKGQTIGIIGGTGSGKTTLVNLIMRLYDVTGGEIKINEVPIKELKKASLRENIAYVPQKAAIFSGTLRSNMQFADKNVTDEQCFKALKTAQAEKIVTDKGEGLDMVIEEGGANLSGGQKQRLTIARALVKNAGLLVLDDSSSALDYATDAALRRAIKEDVKDCTTIIVSQRISSVRDADTIVCMEAGKAVGIGTHTELYKTCAVYKEICDTQLSEQEAAL